MHKKEDGYIVREWRKNDYASLAKHANNINIWNNVRDYFPYPYTVKDAREFILMVQEKSFLQDFAIEVDGRVAGGIGFVPGKDVERYNAEIGYWLGEEYWNRGIMSRALRSMSDYIFQQTEIVRLFATVYEYNKSSMKVLENAGYNKLAVFRKAAYKNEQLIDLHYYELLKFNLR